MHYEYCPNNPERYATGLRRDFHTKNLMWDSARGQDAVIVQTPFGTSAVEQMKEICQRLEEIAVIPDQYTELFGGVWIRFVTAAEKARNSGCPLNGEASTYTVFSCHVNKEVTQIYEPMNQAMISASCDIPLEVHIELKKEVRIEGIIRKKEVETGFYCMIFPAGMGNGYVNGTLKYQIGAFEIPITKEMLEQRTVYVKTQIQPIMFSDNEGMRLV